MDLLPFQHRFIANVLKPQYRTSALSLPRGNGKTSLIAWLAARTLDPTDKLFTHGKESHIVAASLGQAQRTLFKQLRTFLKNPDDYKIADSGNNVAYCQHKATGTKISLLTSSYRSAQGIVDCPWIFADEPAAWQSIGGEAMHDAIKHAQGKPGSRMKTVYIGTRAPADPDSWWLELLDKGTTNSTYVMDLIADRKKWSDKREIRRVNPLMYSHSESRAVVLEELEEALTDSRHKAAFCSYRLNLPTQDESTVLLTVDDWQRVTKRPVPPRNGQPVVALDMGSGRAWSTATAIWPNQRVECRAICPGIPSVSEQEKRDKTPQGAYQRLIDAGTLSIAHGRRVPLVPDLVEIASEWNPSKYVCDSFRKNEVRDAIGRIPLTLRRTVWSESSEDIRGTRRLCLDGDVSIEPDSKRLLQHSLSQCRVENDTAGNSRIIKKKRDNSSRDDVAASFVLALGVLSRTKKRKPPKHYVIR